MRALHVTPGAGSRDLPVSGTVHYPTMGPQVSRQDVIGSTRNAPFAPGVSTAYIVQTAGGSTGVTDPLGYTIGMWPWQDHRLSGATIVAPRQNVAGNRGPVGVSTWQQTLAAGVTQAYAQMPSIEDIYRSMAGGA